MATSQLQAVVHFLRQRAAAHAGSSLPDNQLLERYLAEQDGGAFSLLVERHGPMVLGLCQRVLGNPQDAEDAFQNTFLILLRKAAAIRKQSSVGSWLYGVAYRTAQRARTQRTLQRTHERLRATQRPIGPVSETTGDDLAQVLDEEVNRLPEKYRAPVILCYLRGATYEQAAQQLGCPKGTVAIRLARAREQLRVKLTRRGVTLSVGLLTTALARQAAATVPAELLRTTVQAATTAAATVAVPPSVLALTKTLAETIPMSKFSLLTAALLALGIVLGPGLWIRQSLWSSPPQANAQEQPIPGPPKGLPATVEKPRAVAPAVQPPPADKAQPTATPCDPAQVAQRLWAIMDLVLAQHLNPQPREEMIAVVARALHNHSRGLSQARLAEPNQSKEPPLPDSIRRHIQGVLTLKQFEDLITSLWQPLDVPNRSPDQLLEKFLTDQLLANIPGEPYLLLAPDMKISEQIAANRYVGLGIQLRMDDKEKIPQITLPFRRGVAWKAGIKPGAYILEVEGKSTRDVPLMKVVDWIRGPEGTTVSIVVRQPGATTGTTYRLVRTVTPFDSLQAYRRNSDNTWTYRVDPSLPIAYVWISAIRISTLHELRQLERQLTAEGIRALVLDFRFSDGDGQLGHAALLADGLLDGGYMWGVRHGHMNEVTEFRADRECLFRQWPLAALIGPNIRDRAQGAVLAALQDNKRAILVGEPTRTDGYVNSIVQVPGRNESLLFRTGRLERAVKGRDWPVQPDYTVAMLGTQTKLQEWLRQKDLPELPAGVTDQPPEDPQLARAIALLRDALEARAGAQGK
jgi:RNA polymerase sigma factor (sigma-70 family)